MLYQKFAISLFVLMLLLAGLLFGLTDRSSALQQNLLVNPGFEAGPDSWNVQPSTATFEVVSFPTHQGGKAGSLTKRESKGQALIYQDVSVTTGERYTAQVWAVWNDERLSNVKLRVEWLDESGERLRLDEIAVAERSPTYQLLRLENLEAPPAAVTARVQGYTFVREAGPEQPALFDDFQISTVDVSIGLPTGTPQSLATATVTPIVNPTATPPPVPAGAVVINEVFYDPATPGGDPNDEWVELYNRSEHTVNLEGWVLADHVGEDVLPAVEIPPGTFVVVAASVTFTALNPSYEGRLVTLDGPIGNGLSNGSDSLWLRDNQGQVIDAMAYGEDDPDAAMFPAVPAVPAEGYSLERMPAGRDTNTAADWFPNQEPSPGQGIRRWVQYLPIVVK